MSLQLQRLCDLKKIKLKVVVRSCSRRNTISLSTFTLIPIYLKKFKY